VARQCAVEQVDYQRYLLRMTELELLDRERRCRAALNPRNCLQDDELLQLNPGILDSQCT
jgi:hypothetical protein